jgi:hypothetical protein
VNLSSIYPKVPNLILEITRDQFEKCCTIYVGRVTSLTAMTYDEVSNINK